MARPTVASLMLIFAAACFPEWFLTRSSTAEIHYEVRLRDGGEVPVTIRYRLPSGAFHETRTTTPWESDAMTFREGTQMLIEAEAERVDSPLLCVLASENEDDGAYALGNVDDPLTSCSTHHRMGFWPPNDDDPINNPLIRVG